MPSKDSQIIKLLEDLTTQLEALDTKVDRLEALVDAKPPVGDTLSIYPNQFITPKEALPYLKQRSTQGVYSACRGGQFKPGSELIDISPEGSERPTYLINVYAYFKRLQTEQSPLAS